VVTKDEALKLALEALDSKYIVGCSEWRGQQLKALAAIEEALAQPAQEHQKMIQMVDAAMVEMRNISPPLRRSECERLIRAAISTHPAAQPAQEPVAIECTCKAENMPFGRCCKTTPAAQPAQEPEPDELTIAYMSGLLDGKKKREWVGLTDEEAQWLYDNCRTPSNLIDMVEAKLKEKNT
jgi:hypothetical protein